MDAAGRGVCFPGMRDAILERLTKTLADLKKEDGSPKYPAISHCRLESGLVEAVLDEYDTLRSEQADVNKLNIAVESLRAAENAQRTYAADLEILVQALEEEKDELLREVIGLRNTVRAYGAGCAELRIEIAKRDASNESLRAMLDLEGECCVGESCADDATSA